MVYPWCFIWNACFVPALFIENQEWESVKQEWKFHKTSYSKSYHVSRILSKLYHLSEPKVYITQSYHVTESDVTNALAQWNYVDKLGEVMNRMNKKLQEYFHFIISSQQLTYPLLSWDNKKLLLRKKLNNWNNKRG